MSPCPGENPECPSALENTSRSGGVCRQESGPGHAPAHRWAASVEQVPECGEWPAASQGQMTPDAPAPSVGQPVKQCGSYGRDHPASCSSCFRATALPLPARRSPGSASGPCPPVGVPSRDGLAERCCFPSHPEAPFPSLSWQKSSPFQGRVAPTEVSIDYRHAARQPEFCARAHLGPGGQKPDLPEATGGEGGVWGQGALGQVVGAGCEDRPRPHRVLGLGAGYKHVHRERLAAAVARC